MAASNDPGAAVSPAGGDRRSRDLQVFWDRYFAVYDTMNQAPPYQRMVRRYADLLQPAAGDDILDAGAGTGNVSKVLAVPGARLVGIDFCAPALPRCRAKVPQAEFRLGDLTRPLEFADASFDKLACSLVLHFLEPDRQAFALGEMHRVLRPGGRIALTVFGLNLNPLKVYTQALRDLAATEGLRRASITAVTYLVSSARIMYYQWRIRRGERTGQYRYFSDESLRDMLQRAGFTVTSLEPAMANQCWLAGAVKPAGAAVRR